MEAALHFDAPVQFLMRQAMVDTELHGQQIRKGEIVQVVMGSANRDSESYEIADEFKLDRARANHRIFRCAINIR